MNSRRHWSTAVQGNGTICNTEAKPRTVAVLQSNYLPWRGYFDLINRADLVIFYDDVQFTKNSWRNRNVIKTRQGLQWLSIPVGKDIRRRICDVEIADNNWRRRHWRAISQTYSRSSHFGRYKDFLEEFFLGNQWTNLSRINQYLIMTISTNFLDLGTTFEDSRSFALRGRSSARLLDLLTQVRASTYVTGSAAKNYLDEEALGAAGIQIQYMDYSRYLPYRQWNDTFDGNVSIVDLLCHCGPNSRDLIVGRSNPIAPEASHMKSFWKPVTNGFPGAGSGSTGNDG